VPAAGSITPTCSISRISRSITSLCARGRKVGRKVCLSSVSPHKTAYLHRGSMLPRACLLCAEHSAPSTRAHLHASRSPLSVSGPTPPVSSRGTS
ncbi:hypothetical protein T06_8927, partial [Trichinella sp. T6]